MDFEYESPHVHLHFLESFAASSLFLQRAVLFGEASHLAVNQLAFVLWLEANGNAIHSCRSYCTFLEYRHLSPLDQGASFWFRCILKSAKIPGGDSPFILHED